MQSFPDVKVSFVFAFSVLNEIANLRQFLSEMSASLLSEYSTFGITTKQVFKLKVMLGKQSNLFTL